MKRRLFLCFLAGLLLITSVNINATAEGAVFTLNVPTELPLSGEQLEVTLDISNNPGFCAIQFELDYDETKLKCIGIEMHDIISGALSATNENASGSAVFSSASLDRIQGDGTLVTYFFEVVEDITEFDFKYKNIIFCDENADEISYSVVGVTEYIKEEIPEDEYIPEEDEDEDEWIPEEDEDDDWGYVDYEEEDLYEDPYEDNYDSEHEESDNDITNDVNEEPEPETDSIELESIPVNQSFFEDVKGHWAESFVNKAADLGLFKGDDKGNFNPDDNVTRAQFVTVLWRMAGSPAVDTEVPFTDISNQIDEFKSAIAWGFEKGYINGTTETTFEPDSTLTREAGMKILHYYSGGQTGGEMVLTAIYDGYFEDSSEISGWAKASMYWGVYNKLISGTSETTITPKGTATRAQLAKILVNYLDYIKGN